MLLSADVRLAQRSKIEGVTHADGSTRPQTIKKEHNPLYWKLITAFGELTGTPVLLNTSFNLAGEPVVCSVFDAIRSFYSSGLDYLVIGSFVVTKERG